jgi:hypothetical protein
VNSRYLANDSRLAPESVATTGGRRQPYGDQLSLEARCGKSVRDLPVDVRRSHGYLGAPGFGVHRVTQFAQEACDGLFGGGWWPENFPLPMGFGYVLPGTETIGTSWTFH